MTGESGSAPDPCHVIEMIDARALHASVRFSGVVLLVISRYEGHFPGSIKYAQLASRL